MVNPWYEKSLNEFDPNKLGGMWGTFIPGRNPSWKVHSKRSVALCSNAYGLLYENVDGVWVLRVRQCPSDHHETCQVCGGDTKRQDAYRQRLTDHGRFKWVRSGGKIVSPPESLFVCVPCGDQMR